MPGKSYQYGWTSYHSNCGVWANLNGWDGISGYPAKVDASGSGKAIPAVPGVRFGEIIDGLSNTAAFAEVPTGAGEASAPPTQFDCYVFPSMPSGTCSRSAWPSGPSASSRQWPG